MKRKAGSVTSYGSLVRKAVLGYTECTMESLSEFIEHHNETIWAPETYHILNHNCNHFTDYLANFLLGTGIPPEYIELSERKS